MDVKINAKFKESGTLKAGFKESDPVNAKFGSTNIVHTGDYNELYNKPSINEVELVGNKSFEEQLTARLSRQTAHLTTAAKT